MAVEVITPIELSATCIGRLRALTSGRARYSMQLAR
jgi:translation elongation factor EF-G